MSNFEIAKKYCPHILFDKAEPFKVEGMGYSIFTQPGQSKSFRREFSFDPAEGAFVIEYAVYFDYDIQHLYDLEHIWIYVGQDGKICDAEASFHGFYLKSMSLGNSVIIDGTHLQTYCQPGKHAFMPDGNLFKLLPDWYVCCNRMAGVEGLLVMDMFKEFYSTNNELQKKVANYICSSFAFEPTLQFEYLAIDRSVFYPWEELSNIIPLRINIELKKII
jgi:hypothetical protein